MQRECPVLPPQPANLVAEEFVLAEGEKELPPGLALVVQPLVTIPRRVSPPSSGLFPWNAYEPRGRGVFLSDLQLPGLWLPCAASSIVRKLRNAALFSDKAISENS